MLRIKKMCIVHALRISLGFWWTSEWFSLCRTSLALHQLQREMGISMRCLELCHQTPTGSSVTSYLPPHTQTGCCLTQILLKLGHGFNTYGTSRGMFETGWVLCSSCREISCFLVEGSLLSPFLASGVVQLLFHHLLLFRLVPPMCGGGTEEPQGWLLQLL